ncbi:MAG: PKD domain-containing protein [Actinobacteria bacterium]|nr:PKD domain-containing protein [Actinomycetota bacterium]
MEAPRSLQEPRRGLAGHLTRGLGLGALTLVLLGSAAAPSGAAVGPGVVVIGPNGSGTVTEREIREGTPAQATSYLLRATPGEVGEWIPRAGMSVRKVIEASGVPFAATGYLTVPRPNGTVAYLPGEDFAEPSPAFEEGKSAVISIDGASTRFLRPLIPRKPDDVNAEDNIATVSGEALTIGVHNGSVVEVQVSASTTSTTAGSPVQFTAAVIGGGAFDFSWTFGDGGTASGESVSHPFTGSGTYQVRVTAVGLDESGGESGPVSVVVGNPPSTEAPGASAAPQPSAKQPTGAPGKGRDGRGGEGRKPSAGGEGKTGGNETSAQRGNAPAGRSHHASESSAPSSSVPSPAPPSPEAPPPVPPAPTLPSTPEESSGTSPAASPAASPSRPGPSRGDLVEGRLVGANLGPATIEEALGGSAEGKGSSSAAGAIGSGGAGVPVLALIVVALLAGGALFEWRRGRAVR